MSTAVRAIATLLMAAALGWLLLGDGEPEVALPPGPQAQEGSARPDEAGFAEAAFQAEAAAELAPPFLDGQEPRERIETEDVADGDLLDPGTGPLVVVERLDGQGNREAAADVEVAWIGVAEGAAQAGRTPPFSTPPRGSEQPHRFGRRSRARDDGTLQLPPLDEETWVAVQDGGDFAIGRVRPRQREVRLLLRPDEQLRIVVVDADGKGVANAPLTISRTQQDQGPEALWNGFADARGQAVVAHFQFVRRDPAPGERYAAAVSAPQAQPSWQEFQARPAPSEPLRLQLQDTVPLAVEVVHASGPPIRSPLQVQLLTAALAETPPWSGVLPDTFMRLGGETQRGGGPLLLPHVGPGLRLRPLVRIPGERAPRLLPEVQLPEREALERGRPIELRLPLPADVTALAMCALDADGAALALAELPWQLQRPLTPGQQGSLLTDAAGLGDIVLSARQGAAAPVQEPLRLLLRETLAPDLVLGADAPLGALRPGEWRDLGAIRLSPLPTLCQGRVLDDLGAPQPGAEVLVELALAKGAKDQWVPAPHLRTKADEGGVFSFLAQTPVQPFRLHAPKRASHFAAISPPLSPGARLDLVTARAGILTGRIVPPANTPADAVTLQLVREEPNLEPRPKPVSTPLRRRNGWFWLGGLEPGLYTARVRIRGLDAPAAEIPGVGIGPGENQDARLLPLDLGARLHRYRLTAASPEGRPLAQLDGPILWRAGAADGGAQGPWNAFRWQGGKADFLLPVPLAELTFVGQGLSPQTLLIPSGDRTVLLAPAMPCLVEIPGVRALAGPLRSIRVSAILERDSGLPQGLSGQDLRDGKTFSFPRWQLGKSGGGWLDAGDRAEIVVSQSGPYQLLLRLHADDKREGRQAEVRLGVHELKVDGSRIQPLVVPVDQAELLAALATFGAPATPAPVRNGARRR